MYIMYCRHGCHAAQSLPPLLHCIKMHLVSRWYLDMICFFTVRSHWDWICLFSFYTLLAFVLVQKNKYGSHRRRCATFWTFDCFSKWGKNPSSTTGIQKQRMLFLLHCPEDDLVAARQWRLVGGDSEGALCGSDEDWVPNLYMSCQSFDFICRGLRPVLATGYIFTQTVCCMWIENAVALTFVFDLVTACPSPPPPQCGRSDHNPFSVRLGCIYTCTSMQSSTLQLQSNHQKCILMQGVTGVSVSWKNSLNNLYFFFTKFFSPFLPLLSKESRIFIQSYTTCSCVSVELILLLVLTFLRVRVQVPFQRSYPGPGSDPSVPARCFLHQTFLQGAAPTVSTHTHTCVIYFFQRLKQQKERHLFQSTQYISN